MAKPLFSFAVISDTHIRPRGGDDTSPYPVNELANARARYATAAIARHKPSFTIHLGDMVHPLPDMPTYAAACEEALEIFKPLGPAMRYVAGNHDIGDKPHEGTPAGAITARNMADYEAFFGPTWFSFDQGNCHFAVINSSLVNSGGTDEARQRAWLEEDLAANGQKRLFLFSHYPLFICTPDEPTHFDNYAEPGRDWLLTLAKETGVEAVFSGHVHNFFYARHGETKFHILPSTCFVRQDFAEMYFTPPKQEYGRNDLGKFAFAMVDVFPDGHALRVIPTEGRELEDGDDLLTRYPDQQEPARPIGGDLPLKIPLRHSWAAVTDLSFNGPFEEFFRKPVRNDYSLMRLQQMGTMHLRVPISDLMKPELRSRMEDYHAAGCRFTICSKGAPTPDAWMMCREHAAMLDTIEFITAKLDMSDLKDGIATLTPIDGVSFFVGLAHSSVHETAGAKFSHAVSFGYKWERREDAIAGLQSVDSAKTSGGLVFQINLTDDITARLQAMDAFAGEHAIRVSANIRFADEDPAAANFDDDAIAARVRQAVETVRGLKDTDIQFDTFADVDRGYHPRHGLVDQLYNFRPAGRYLAGMS